MAYMHETLVLISTTEFPLLQTTGMFLVALMHQHYRNKVLQKAVCENQVLVP